MKQTTCVVVPLYGLINQTHLFIYDMAFVLCRMYVTCFFFSPVGLK